ncbi:E3 ubiquitin-protein ligase TRIM39-like isoform X2 [Lissotriton helveticus]
MAAAGSVKLEDEATCAICLEYFKNPVIIDCGHNFCQSCILKCWQGIDTNFSCPECRTFFPEIHFRPNRQLGNLVEMVKLHLPSLKPQESVCQKHQQRLQLFCKDDQEPICEVCDRSGEHLSHTVIPVEEAAQEYKKTVQNSLDKMKTDLEDVKRLTSEENEKETDLEEEFQSQTQRINNTFEGLHQFLDKEKQDLLSKVEIEHKKNVKEIRMKKTDLEKQNSSFMDQITEMEGKCQQEGVMFLMGVKSLLNRYEYSWNLSPTRNSTLNKRSLQNSYTFSDFVLEKIRNLKEQSHTELEWIFYKNFGEAPTLEQDTLYTVATSGSDDLFYLYEDC